MKVEMKNPYFLLFLEDGSWYFIDQEGIHTVLIGFNVSQEQLLNNLIMFESSSIADTLCAVNKWDRRTLRLHALQLGLKFVFYYCFFVFIHRFQKKKRHRQIDVIEPALQNLDSEQKLRGIDILLDFINPNNVAVQDEDFVEHLIQIGTKLKIHFFFSLKCDSFDFECRNEIFNKFN